MDAADPAGSLIPGTNKAAAPRGALVVFGLDGQIRQRVVNLDRPNNVDVEYGLALGGERVDIAVVRKRLKNRLNDDGQGKVKATEVRRFGAFPGGGEIEAVAVDDAAGFVYYAGETYGIHKWRADPQHAEAGREVAVFGRIGWQGDDEGIAIDARPDGSGYIVCTDQIDGDTHYHLFRRQGGAGGRHDHAEMVRCVRGGADASDGIEVAATGLGTRFPKGLMVVMNSAPGNFLLFRRDETLAAARLP